MHKICLVLFVFIITLAGCDNYYSEGLGPPVYQTRILDVIVEPNPVAVGDTATFTVVIKDSLDSSFRFRWFLDAPSFVTEENSLRWIANVEPRRHGFSVRADNGDPDAQSVGDEFAVEVVE